MRNNLGNLAGNYIYRKIPIGAMGYTTGIVTAADESWQLVKTDGAGAYRRDDTSEDWKQCFRRDNTSAALFGFDPVTGESDGSWEAEIASSNVNVAYASFRHRIVKSTDKGLNWTLCTAVPEMRMNSNAQGGSPSSYQRLCCGKLAIDPSNADVVYWAPEGQGLLRTLNGMTSYAKIASVPDAVSPYSRANTPDHYMMVAIDETSSLISGRHSKVAVASIGNGIYLSNDGGDTFTQISATLLFPCNIQYIGGTLYVLDYLTTGNVAVANTNIYTYNGTVFSSAFGYTAQAVRYIQQDLTDPATFFGSRFLVRSTNSGVAWTDVTDGDGSNVYAVGRKAPLMAGVFNDGKALFNSRLSAHSNGRIYISTGYGIMYAETANWKAATKTPTKVPLVLYEDTAGIENIVPQQALITPLGDAFMLSQDKAIIKVAPLGAFPQSSYPASALTNGYDIDYAGSDPTYLAAIYQNKVAVSTNRGETWADTPTFGTNKFSGGIAVINPGHIVVVPGQNGWPTVTNNGGATWADCIFSGFTKITSGETGWGFGNIETDRFIVCNDKQNPLTVWAFNYGVGGNVAATIGVWKSTDGGFNFTRVHSTKIVSSIQVGFHNKLSHRNGILWFNSHYTTPFNSLNAGNYLYRSLDEGVTWEQAPGLDEPYQYAFGKALVDGAYPALWSQGWVGGVKGLWRCDNANVVPIAGMTWTQVDASPEFARPTAFAADPSKYGRTITGRGGMSFEEQFYSKRFALS